VKHVTREELEAGLDEIRLSPKNEGILHCIARRPKKFEREILQEGHLDLVEGLVGDDWIRRGSSRTPDGASHPDMQINIMNSRAISLFAQDRDRWPLAGDQLYIDLDLSPENLPPWTKLELGSAMIEVTDQPHTACYQFVSRFGLDAMKFANSPVGRSLNLRGINARVIKAGVIRVGDVVRKI
jgi:hypothetical protein